MRNGTKLLHAHKFSQRKRNIPSMPHPLACGSPCSPSPTVVFNSSSTSCVSMSFWESAVAFPRFFDFRTRIRKFDIRRGPRMRTRKGKWIFSMFSQGSLACARVIRLYFISISIQVTHTPLIHKASSVAVCCVMSIQNLSTFGMLLVFLFFSSLLFFLSFAPF